MGFEIRKALGCDAEELLSLLMQIGSESDNLTFGEEGLPFTVEEEGEYIKKINSSSKSAIFVALDDGRIVGMSSFSGHLVPRLSHRGEVSVAVRKSSWGKGIGTKLLEAAIIFGRDIAKAEIISLEVRSDNTRAIKLYERLGFEKIGAFKGFLKINGEDITFDLMNLCL